MPKRDDTIIQAEIRARFKQILDARRVLAEDDSNIIVNKDSFMKMLSEKAYLHSDNPAASLKGLYNVDDYVTYYCPLEDFTEEELDDVGSSLKCYRKGRN